MRGLPTSERSGGSLLAFLLALLLLPNPAPAPAVSILSGASREEIETLQAGLDDILHRRYDRAMARFRAYGERNPHAPIAPIGESLVYQARMYEGNHFRFTKAYEAARDRAKARLRERAPATAWYYFQAASIDGLEGLFKIRREKWLAALRDGLRAIDALEKGLALDPDFFDARLGTGIYLYAKSFLGKKHWFIPFSDHRQEGIAEIERAIEKGRLLPEISKMTLALIFLNERRPKEALGLIRPLREKYPENLLLRMLLGRIYMTMRRYEAAIREFHELLRLDAGQTRALYYIGRSYLFQRKSLDRAEKYLKLFLATDPERKWQAYANFRLGQVEERRGNLERAVTYWKRAIELKPDYKAPKARIEWVRKRVRSRKTAQRIETETSKTKDQR